VCAADKDAAEGDEAGALEGAEHGGFKGKRKTGKRNAKMKAGSGRVLSASNGHCSRKKENGVRRERTPLEI
jgi:hypothetical protein